MNEEQRNVAAIVTQGDIRRIKEDITQVTNQVQEVHHAVVGSKLGKDGGLVQRIIDCEQTLDEIRKQIRAIENQDNKREIYVRIIWALAAGLIMTIFSLVINYYFHAPPKLP